MQELFCHLVSHSRSFIQVVTFYLREGMTVEDFLAASCLKRSLDPVEHFVRVKKRRAEQNSSSQKYFVPHRADLIETYVSERHHLKRVVHRLSFDYRDLLKSVHQVW